MRVWVVMPAFNEEKSIGKVISDLRGEGWKKIIVVDDGSKDRTSEIAKSKRVLVVRHPKNMGLGAALRTGIQKARELGAEAVVTFDADGQHDPKAIGKLVEALEEADVVIGSRIFVGIPLHKRIGNFGLNFITRVIGGLLVDSQSGMRAFNKKALERIRIRSNRYEVSSEIVLQSKRKGLRVKEIPVRCYFTPYSKARGTTIASGVRIAIHLLKLRALGN